VVVVGAGFAGRYVLQRLRRMGLSASVLESGAEALASFAGASVPA
jgi:cation diffusion facilitator CzcD-associated flavoprotein CzcO